MNGNLSKDDMILEKLKYVRKHGSSGEEQGGTRSACCPNLAFQLRYYKLNALTAICYTQAWLYRGLKR